MYLTTENPQGGTVVAHLLVTHGASQSMTSRFFQTLVPMLLEHKIAVSRFEFAYMVGIRESGKRRPPPRLETLFPEFRAAVDSVSADCGPGRKLLIGGKSMGGRVASMLADEFHAKSQIAGLVCLGYPFHPPKKPDSLRTAHLSKLKTPTLIAQGVRDPFGTAEDVAGYDLSPNISMHWVGDGDHDFGPRGKSGFTRKANIAGAAAAIAEFAAALPPSVDH